MMWEYKGQKRPPFAKEPGPGEESVWDYPRPPVTDKDEREVIVRSGNHLIAQTTHAIRVLETASPPGFYIPLEDVNLDLLDKNNRHTHCEWKGQADYWDLKLPDQVEIHNAAWSYPSPNERFASIKDYLAFYPDKVECYVDGEQVKPQPGGFYGGWITKEIAGPVKGESPETYL